tara:strand:+ start:3647 stop:5452 length:1806 start_codon:yes stop_codon:yes gene_type:complete
MGLIDLQTDLKSLKFGKDRFGGGDSGQPFIQNPIIDEPGKLTTSGTDFLLRGGARAPLNAAEDVARLTKYMFSAKSPSGLLFIAKQNLLSRVAPKTESSKGLGYAGGALNAGIYTPLSTLAQAGVGFLGAHLNKQGIDPTGLISPLSINNYEDIIKSQDENRLVTLTNLIKIGDGRNNFNFTKGYTLNRGNSIIEYGGGPGSKLGIGKTKINFADQRTGNKNPLKLTNPSYFEKGGIKLHTSDIDLIKPYKGLSGKYESLNLGLLNNNIITGSNGYELGFENSSYSSLYEESQESKTLLTSGNQKSSRDLYNEETTAPNDSPTYLTSLNQKYPKPSTKLSSEYSIENRLNLGDPGRVKGTHATDVKDKSQVLDQINASPIYETTSKKGRNSGDYNDIIAFRIGIIDPEDPSNTTYMNFRAFIDGFSDSYSANWDSQEYLGRAEKFYKYGGFDRDISLSFTVVAQSQGEMHGMYQKLNYLASTLAPTYTKYGYMAGNLSKLTVGDYIYEQTGFISSITYDIPEESSWELSLTPSIGVAGSDENRTAKNPDELPYMVKVTGFKFTPIHQFRPEIQPNPGEGIGSRFITNKLPLTTKWQKDLKQ